MTIELIQLVERALKYAPDGDPDGYAIFYGLRMNKPLPRHGRDWIEQVYKSHQAGRGTLWEAARGFTKTTHANVFMEYRIGLEPERRNCIFRASDDKAKESTSWIATDIENDIAFRALFPNVVPDKESTWSAKGYDVKRTDIPYSEWRRIVISQDPCLTGYGVESDTALGSHPTGMMLIDDINTEKNTYSDRERAQVIKTLQDTILPMAVPNKTWLDVVGTPWRADDSLAWLKSTGAFDCLWLPAQEDGLETGAPTWPEVFDEKALAFQKQILMEIGYARQMLLNLNAAMGQTLKLEWLHTFPHQEVNPSWERIMGVDYASTDFARGTKSKDDFVIALGYLIPGGGVIITDGYADQLSQGEAEIKLVQWADNFQPRLIGIEDVTESRQFYQSMVRNTRLPVWPSPVHNRNKGDRFEKDLGPIFQFGRMKLSDELNPFLKKFKDQWIAFPRNSTHDDTLDGVWHLSQAAQQCGALKTVTSDYTKKPPPKKKKESIYELLARA